MNTYYVYYHLRSIDSDIAPAGTPYYVGKGCGNRAWSKRKFLPNDPNNIVIIAQNLTESEAFELEISEIARWGRVDLGTGILRNKTNGGEGVSGTRWSTERRKSWSGTNNPNYGVVPWKRSGKNPMLGKKHTAESRLKMSKKIKESYTSDLLQKRRDAISGTKNPGYGKPAKNRRAVTFRGLHFDCIRHACEYFGITKGQFYREEKASPPSLSDPSWN